MKLCRSTGAELRCFDANPCPFLYGLVSLAVAAQVTCFQAKWALWSGETLLWSFWSSKTIMRITKSHRSAAQEPPLALPDEFWWVLSRSGRRFFNFGRSGRSGRSLVALVVLVVLRQRGAWMPGAQKCPGAGFFRLGGLGGVPWEFLCPSGRVEFLDLNPAPPPDRKGCVVKSAKNFSTAS